MQRIILASRSKARRKLLKTIGLKFLVAESNIKEKSFRRGRYSDLVIGNALAKAKDVAKRYDSGIVIAADTVVLAGGKIIGKPSNMKEAFKILKLVSSGPQWVYTGLAVIDIGKKKVNTACEKTKIYMYHLGDREIKNYFKRVSPLDKAGGFDIQGLGGIFIDRIEGCFYNVVGLPLARLAKMLKNIGIEIF